MCAAVRATALVGLRGSGVDGMALRCAQRPELKTARAASRSVDEADHVLPDEVDVHKMLRQM